MIRGVRRPEEAQGLGLSRRLMVRLGALLKKGVALTPALLESARPGSALETFLLDSEVLAQAAVLDEAALDKLLKAHKKDGIEPLALVNAEDGVRVLCFEEEQDADGGWTSGEPQAPAASGLPAGSSASLALREPVLGAHGSASPAEAVFGRGEIDRLRLKLVTAAAEAERIEALRVLAHAPLSSAEKAEALFQGLGDKSAAVRSEAAGLLFVLGVPDDLGELLAALSQGAEKARLRAADQLLKRLASARDLELGAAAVCALAVLKDEGPTELAARTIELMRLCAPALLNTPARVAELVRVVLAKLSLGEDAKVGVAAGLSRPSQRLLKALCEADRAVTLAVLREERAKAADARTQAFLLLILLDVQPPGEAGEAELLEDCTAFIARDEKEARESRTIGRSLLERGEAALKSVVEAFGAASPGAQKYFLRLMDDFLRFQKISPEMKEKAAGAILRAIESGNRGLRMVAMGCRGATDPDLSDETRAKLADAFLGSITDFGFQTEVEIAEDCIAQMGLPAIPALTQRLAREIPAERREQSVRILGNLARGLNVARGKMEPTREAVTGILRRLQEVSLETDFAGRGAVFAAMGKLASSPAATKQAGEVVSRSLLQAVQDESVFVQTGALEGLTWLAAARRATPELIATVTGLLRRTMDEAQDDLPTQNYDADQMNAIEITGGHNLVEKLPVALAGISRIARSGSCPTAIAAELTAELVARWRKIVDGELVWGPANAMMVVQALQEIGCQPELPPKLRLTILKALALRLTHPPVMHAMTRILGEADFPESSVAALTVGLAITGQRRPDGRFDPEDREEILKSLARIAARKYLGAPDAPGKEKARRFRKTVIDDLLQGAKDLVSGVYPGLVALRDAKVLDAEDQESLERRMAELHAMVVA